MPKILLVEDNELNRDMLSRRLQRKGYEVLMASMGSRACRWRRLNHPTWC
jgi:CheY-like chemotaxis protein